MADKVESLDEARAKRDSKKKGGRGGGKTKAKGGECPVVPLGHANGDMHYLSPAGELRVLAAEKHKREQLLALFCGKEEWLTANAPQYDRDGNLIGGWSPGGAAKLLIKACAGEGLFDERTSIRGPGVWRRPSGKLAVNAGNALLIDGAWQRVGQKIDGAIYTASAPRERPGGKACDRDEAADLLDALRLWEYETANGAELVLGFIGAAMLGGAPSWRVHMLVSGEAGSGKSALSDLVKATLGGGASDANDTTEAGLRQVMTNEAGAIILDEAESDETTAGRINAVIHLLRRMSSGEGVKAQRGSPGGKAQTFAVTGCAWLAAILPPPLKPQDRTRIAQVRLQKLTGAAVNPGGADAVRQALEDMAELSPALRARAVEGWPRFLETFGAYRKAFLAAGCDSRDSDRIATLLAGQDLLLRDDVPPAEVVDEAPETYRELLVDAAAQVDENEGAQCLNRLLTSASPVFRSGSRETVAELVMRAMPGGDRQGGPDNSEIMRIGLKVRRDENGDFGLLVANRHEGLEDIFAGSRWAGGGWANALRYLAGAEAYGKTVRYTGAAARATWLPALHMPLDEAFDQGG